MYAKVAKNIDVQKERMFFVVVIGHLWIAGLEVTFPF